MKDIRCGLAAWAIAFTAPLAAAQAAGAGEISGARIIIGTATAMPGEQTDFAVTLATDVLVAGTQNDITFTPPVRIAALGNDRPDCQLNPALGPQDPTFAFQPAGCDPASTCTAIRALALAFFNTGGGIPDGTILYTCTVSIPADTPAATYPLEISNVGAADADGEPVDATGTSGAVIVTVPSPTPTQTPAAASATPTVTPRPANADDDGCAVAPNAQRGAWWLLLAVILLALRRRRH